MRAVAGAGRLGGDHDLVGGPPGVGVEGEQQPDYLGWMRSAFLLSVLRVPAASVPAGTAPSGLPVGLQVVGRPGDDLGVLRLCAALERVLPPTPAPDLSALHGWTASVTWP